MRISIIEFTALYIMVLTIFDNLETNPTRIS
jgi:hypothetical protein